MKTWILTVNVKSDSDHIESFAKSDSKDSLNINEIQQIAGYCMAEIYALAKQLEDTQGYNHNLFLLETTQRAMRLIENGYDTE